MNMELRGFNMTTRECLNCGTPFQVSWNHPINHVYCSNNCRHYALVHRNNPNMHYGSKDSNNSQWKGDEVSYNVLHDYIKRHKPKPKLCEDCHEQPSYDLANISGEYHRDINDFKWVCRRCHMRSDGRMNNLKQFHIGIKPKEEEE